jgi:hypothetical protein
MGCAASNKGWLEASSEMEARQGGARNLVVHRCIAYRTHVANRDWGIAGWSGEKASGRNAMKRFSVICSRCGLSVNRLIDAETAQTEIYPVPYQQKCKIAPNAADFDSPELERAVERSRRWDPIFRPLHNPLTKSGLPDEMWAREAVSPTRAKASGVHRGRPPALKPLIRRKKKPSDYETKAPPRHHRHAPESLNFSLKYHRSTPRRRQLQRRCAFFDFPILRDRCPFDS